MATKVQFIAIFEILPTDGSAIEVCAQHFNASSLEDAARILKQGTDHHCQNPYGKKTYTLGRCSVAVGNWRETGDTHRAVKNGPDAFARHLEIRDGE